MAAHATGRRSVRDAGARLLEGVLGSRPHSAGDLPLHVPERTTDEAAPSRFGVLHHDLARPVSHLLAALRLATDRDAGARGRIIQAHAAAAAPDLVLAAGFWREALLASPDAAND